MQLADLVVVGFYQNKPELEQFFSHSYIPFRNTVYVILNYQDTSSPTCNQIKHDYRLTEDNIGYIPYNIRYQDLHPSADPSSYFTEHIMQRPYEQSIDLSLHMEHVTHLILKALQTS